MKIILVFLLGFSTLFGAKYIELDKKYQNSLNCKVCHLRIVNEWKSSWHAKSHYKNDEYFQASIDYISRKTRKSLNGVKVECALCHNPRISITTAGQEYEIDAIMGLDKGSAVNKAVTNSTISEGINCVVCHNIDKIHDEYDATKRGMDRVEWTKSGTMVGVFEDSQSPYHKIVHHKFMNENSNKLCFVCHANDRSRDGLVFTNMQSEYKKGSKSCVACHMGERKKDVASTYKMHNGVERVRELRTHSFIGGHKDSMWRDALSLSLEQDKENIVIGIYNPQPHNIPSGFGSREIIVDVTFKKGMKIIDEKSISLTQYYLRKKTKPTIAHLADKQSEDMSIPAQDTKVLNVIRVKSATSVEAKIYYRLVNDEVRTLLNLQGENWAEKHFISEAYMKLQ